MAALPQSQPHLTELRWREHGERVLEFQREVYERNFPGFHVGPAFLVDYERQLRSALRNTYEGLWVIEEGSRAQAFVWAAIITTLVDEKLGYIKNVYVTPERRHLGWGAVLTRHAEDWMRRLGVFKSALDVTVENETAVSLYARCGYHVQRYRMEKDLQAPCPQPEEEEL
ncbi:MAG: GNAT family N-acetyltransferase [candidate division WS1 bacterium]|nr:GNAT family N-acetyltransferase [candidate division WS1 bacterium]